MLQTSTLVKKLLTAKLLTQRYPYHKLRKTFSKFYRQYYDFISKFHVGLNYLCFISFLYLDLYVLETDALICYEYIILTKHLCVLVHIRPKGEVGTVKHV